MAIDFARFVRHTLTVATAFIGLAFVAGPALADDHASDGTTEPPPDAAGDETNDARDFAHWRIDAGLTFGHFEQQVKVEIGGAKGEKLVTDSEFGLNLFATFNPIEYLGFGLFMQVDVGTREAGRFEGVDADDMAVTSGELGGPYTEFWVGPIVRGQWSTLFAEVGYGFGLRADDGRSDLPAIDGDTDGALMTSPAVAWLFAVGAGVPIIDGLQAVLRIEYRVRYYDRRTSGDLDSSLVHGTQNLTPFVGIAWEIDAP